MIRKPFDHIKFLLDEWGEWVETPIPGLGCPSMSVEARMMEGGSASTAKPFLPPYEGNKRASNTNAAINAMNNQVWQQMITCKHAKLLKTGEMEIVFELSRKKISEELNCAYAFLSGWMRV